MENPKLILILPLELDAGSEYHPDDQAYIMTITTEQVDALVMANVVNKTNSLTSSTLGGSAGEGYFIALGAEVPYKPNSVYIDGYEALQFTVNAPSETRTSCLRLVAVGDSNMCVEFSSAYDSRSYETQSVPVLDIVRAFSNAKPCVENILDLRKYSDV